ncbi:MAG TPA: hypothetical protein V6D22_16575 [Candidatus Obscuribacterales bacterium]
MAKKDTLLYYECDEHQFHRDFPKQLEAAAALVLLLSPFLHEFAVDRYLRLFKALIIRGRRVCIFTQEPIGWKRRHDPKLHPDLQRKCREFEQSVRRLREIGVHVTVRRKVHIKAYVIDELIVWFGSMNALSHKDAEETMTYFNSRSHVARMIARFGLDACAECALNPEYTLFSSARQTVAQTVKLLWQALGARRQQLGLNKSEIARRVGLSRCYLSLMSAGKRDAKLEVILSVCKAVDYELVLVPRYMVPAVAELMAGHLQSMEGLAAGGNSLEMLPDLQKQFGDHEILSFEMIEIRKKL